MVCALKHLGHCFLNIVSFQYNNCSLSLMYSSIIFFLSLTWTLQFCQTSCSKVLVNTYCGKAITLLCYDQCTCSYYVFFALWNSRNEREARSFMCCFTVWFGFLAVRHPLIWVAKAINTLSNQKYFLQKEKYCRFQVKYKMLLLEYEHG